MKENNLDDIFNHKSMIETLTEMSNSAKEKHGEIDSSEFKNISIDDIEFNKDNDYPIGSILELAMSIRDVGLRQPIEIRRSTPQDNTDKKYVLVVGERRLRSVMELRDRATKAATEENPNRKEIKKYSVIKARVLDEDEKKNEYKILKDTNDTARVTSLFQKILSLNPAKGKSYFGSNDEEISRKNYVERKYGYENFDEKWKDYLNGKLQIKWNDTTANEDILLRVSSSSENVPERTIEEYIKLAKNLSESMKKYLQKVDTLSILQIKKIADLDYSVQDKVAKKLEDGKTFEEAINGYGIKITRELKTKKASSKKEKAKLTPRNAINKTTNSLVKSLRDYKEIIDSIDVKELNGNQKERIKLIKSIQADIAKLSEMDK